MYKILLADDEQIVLDSLQYMIHKSFPGGCVLETAHNGREAMQKAETFLPDIVFMDIQMPGVNGIEAVRGIKAICPAAVFIMLTAYDKFDYAQRALNLGVSEYLLKPVSRAKVTETLQEMFAKVEKERRRNGRGASPADYENRGEEEPLYIRESGEYAGDKENKAGRITLFAVEFIDKNFHKDITLEDVSSAVSLSPYYFSKLFKSETGENFIDYLTCVRINKAKELLKNKSLSVKEICFTIGYSDPNYFSRNFKKIVGVTPTEYRESL